MIITRASTSGFRIYEAKVDHIEIDLHADVEEFHLDDVVGFDGKEWRLYDITADAPVTYGGKLRLWHIRGRRVT